MSVKRRDAFHFETVVTLESIGEVTVSTILLQPELIMWETCLFWGPCPRQESTVVGRITPPWLHSEMEKWHDDWCKPESLARQIAEHVKDQRDSEREYQAWLDANGPE